MFDIKGTCIISNRHPGKSSPKFPYFHPAQPTGNINLEQLEFRTPSLIICEKSLITIKRSRFDSQRAATNISHRRNTCSQFTKNINESKVAEFFTISKLYKGDLEKTMIIQKMGFSDGNFQAQVSSPTFVYISLIEFGFFFIMIFDTFYERTKK